MKKIVNVISAIILVITFIFVVLLVFTRIQGKTPEVFGYQILRVSSSSMEPRLEVGDVILSKKVDDITSLKLGDIITYKGESGSYSGKLITHEVTLEPYEYNSKYYLQTMGIANTLPDPEISEDQVVGIMICTLPFLSGVYNFFMTPWGLIIVLGFLAILFVNEAFALKKLVSEDKASDADLSDNEVDTQ